MTDTAWSSLDKLSCGGNSSQNGTVQRRSQEFSGSNKLAEKGEDRHKHRYTGVTSEMTLIPGAPPWLIYSSPNYRNSST
ncbi:MAG: hypothetical protein A4E53_02759 [Pelotomaculum sp. PtaB.Bin104]|nr:MAG: hypothetical protein A4E53_02759 [Pelotomaculum sp. PtaB.Bin104]